MEGSKRGIVVPQGLLAHGRGEAFDYLLGEKTLYTAKKATITAAAYLLSAHDPVISVNGNAAALVPKEISRLASITPAKVEVNLFHRSLERQERIANLLRKYGIRPVLGVDRRGSSKIQGVSSQRERVDPKGIGSADVVLVPLEDGDRTVALERAGKAVVAIDLNPLSRTAQTATVTIVDNIVRALPQLVTETNRLKGVPKRNLENIKRRFDNRRNLDLAVREIVRYLKGWYEK